MFRRMHRGRKRKSLEKLRISFDLNQKKQKFKIWKLPLKINNQALQILKPVRFMKTFNNKLRAVAQMVE